MDYRRLFMLLLLVLSLYAIVPAVHAQIPELQLALIGHGVGPYYAPTGQTTQFKIEILNSGPEDVYLVRGDSYLDPNLAGNWQLVHAEEMGNFHLSNLQSAIWTFDLAMPSSIHAVNVTHGIPQVTLLIQIEYSTGQGLQGTAKKMVPLSVPGASVGNADYWIWFVPIGLTILVILVIVYRRKSKRVSRSLINR